MAPYIGVVPTIEIVASDNVVFGCAPRAVSRIVCTWSIASVLNGSNFVSTMYRAERPSGEMNTLAAFLKSSVVRICGGTYMPDIEGDEAFCLIDCSRPAAWLNPPPIFLV